jgi:hypothetical protein
MWSMLLFLFILFFLSLNLFKQKEGFDNPYITSQEQQGDIVSFRKQLNKITISDEFLNTMQEQVTNLSTKTTNLQTNVPNEEVKKYTQY